MAILLHGLLTWIAIVATVGRAIATSSVSANSWGPQRLDIFGASGSDVYHKYYNPDGWEPRDGFDYFEDANVSSQVSLLSRASNSLDIFFVGKGGEVLHKYWTGSEWGPSHGYEYMGKGVKGPLGVASWAKDRMDIVAWDDSDGTCLHKAWTGDSWYPGVDTWENFGNSLASPPSVVSWGPNRADIFGIDTKGKITHKWWDGWSWQPSGSSWEDLGGPSEGLKGVITTTSMYKDRMDVWAVGSNSGELYHLFWNSAAGSWSEWESLGSSFDDAPQVVHWGPNRIDILGLDRTSHDFLYKFWDGYQWSEWYGVGGGPSKSQPALVSTGPNNLNLIVLDEDMKLKLKVWDGSQWLPNTEEWYGLGQPGKDSRDTSAKFGVSKDQKQFQSGEDEL